MSRVLLIAVAALSLGSPAFAEASAGEPKAGQDDATAGRRLADAVKRQDSNTIDALLSGAVNVNTPQADGATALHWAVYHDDLDMVNRLHGAGATPNASNTHGVTPLALACTNANAQMVQVLLAAGADASVAAVSGVTPLMECARTGNVEAVEALLATDADVNAIESEEEQTALMWAVSQRHASVVAALIDAGVSVPHRSSERRHVISRRLQSELKYGERGRRYGTDAEETTVGGYTALLFAARQGDVDSARLLLAAGADANDTAPDGTSALLIAAQSGHGAFARFLLNEGANPNAAAGGYTPLHAAVLTGDLDVVGALLAHGARPNAQVIQATRVTRNGQVLMLGEHLLGATPFALAAKFTEVDIMRELLAAEADPLLGLTNGWTPLMLASGASWRFGVWDRRDRALARDFAFQAQHADEQGTLDAVRLVVETGADIDAVDEDGNTALHHVVDKGFDRVVEYLVGGGADVNASNGRGQTPLDVLRRRSANREAADATARLLEDLGTHTR